MKAIVLPALCAVLTFILGITAASFKRIVVSDSACGSSEPNPTVTAPVSPPVIDNPQPSRLQRQCPRPTKQHGVRLKLEYGNPDLKSDNYTPPAVAPITMSSDRLLVPVGDTLYMLDSNNRIVWDYPFEPDIIRDVMVDPKGDIYVTASEALILVLNSSGKEIRRTGMSTGSAWYTQIKSYGDGFLVIVDMEAYREKGSQSEDFLEFWKDRKQQWIKPFPRGAKLQVVGNRILAIATTKEGRKITEIRD